MCYTMSYVIFPLTASFQSFLSLPGNVQPASQLSALALKVLHGAVPVEDRYNTMVSCAGAALLIWEQLPCVSRLYLCDEVTTDRNVPCCVGQWSLAPRPVPEEVHAFVASCRQRVEADGSLSGVLPFNTWSVSLRLCVRFQVMTRLKGVLPLSFLTAAPLVLLSVIFVVNCLRIPMSYLQYKYNTADGHTAIQYIPLKSLTFSM